MAMRRMSRFRRRSRPFRRTTLRRPSRLRAPQTGRSGQKDSYLTATGGSSAGGWNYKRKRFNKKRWVRQLRTASDALQKHRSNNALPFILPSAIVSQQMRVNFYAGITEPAATGFWQTAGGLVVLDGDTAATDFGGGDLYIRGGKCTITITNLSANGSIIKLRTWKIRTTGNGAVLASNFVVSQDWDPSLPDPLVPNTRIPGDFINFMIM